MLTFIILVQCAVNAQNTSVKQDVPSIHAVTLTEDSYGAAYPAVILDLDTHELIKFDSKETKTEAEFFKGIHVENGFFIEPNDPEFSAINTINEEVSVKLVVLDQHTTVTLEEAKKMEITSTDIRSFKSGLLFIVKTLDEKFYKFQIISLDEDKNALKFQYEIIE